MSITVFGNKEVVMENILGFAIIYTVIACLLQIM